MPINIKEPLKVFDSGSNKIKRSFKRLLWGHTKVSLDGTNEKKEAHGADKSRDDQARITNGEKKKKKGDGYENWRYSKTARFGLNKKKICVSGEKAVSAKFQDWLTRKKRGTYSNRPQRYYQLPGPGTG